MEKTSTRIVLYFAFGYGQEGKEWNIDAACKKEPQVMDVYLDESFVDPSVQN